MPAIATYDRLIEIVRKSGLVTETRFDAFLQRYQAAGGEEEPAPLATQLVREGLVTTFQAKQLLQGRWRRFVINNKYKVLDLLGQGGMGAVYLCEHTLMRRLVALKVLPEEKLQQPGALERFQREARAVATLDHPNIVHAYDMDRDDNNMHFMVMEYVDGLSLEIIVSKLYKSVGMDPIRVAHYVSQAALGLQHAHECNWVHRDIKPANLLVDRQGVVKLLDLGLSRLYSGDEEQLTKKYDGGSVLGTADYIAPEQALNVSGVDIRADIYGLGATFYFMLAGRPPFEKGTVTQKLMYHQTREPDSLTKLRPEIPAEMEAVVRTMMAKNPDDRYPNPAAVVEALAPWTQEPIPPPLEKELPNHCPAIRRLLPTYSATSPRSSGSWNIRSLQSTASSPSLRTPTPSTPPSGPIQLSSVSPSGRLMPPTTQARLAETVVDHAGRQAVTPKSLPKIPRTQGDSRPKSGASSPQQGKSSRDKNIYLWIAGGAIAFLVIVLGLFAFIFLQAFSETKSLSPPKVRPDYNSTSDDTESPSDSALGKQAPPPAQSNPSTQPPDSGQASAVPTITPAQAAQYLNRDVTLEVTVRSTGEANTRLFLNSEANHRDDKNFAVVIPKPLGQDLFARIKVRDLADLEGKTLRIRGKVTEFSGKPQMEVREIDQITLAD